MDGAPGDVDPGGQRVFNAVPPRERREQRWVCIENSSWERVVHRFGEHGPKSGHRHETDPPLNEGVRHRSGIGIAIEVRSKAAVVSTIEQDCLDSGCTGDLEATARPVGQYRGHGDPRVKNGFKNGAAS
jgi:hypothetical protein